MRRVKQRGPSPFIAGLIAIVVITVGCYFGFTKANPFADFYELEAAFKTVNDLKAKSPVRIAGVNVGKVKSVEPQPGGGAIVKMELEEKGLPIHRDARLKVRPRIFLEGNYFVELSPGSPSAPIAEEGFRFPATQTDAPVQFGQVLSALQSDTRQDLQRVLQDYGAALDRGGARGYNRSIKYWEPAFRDSALVNEATLGEFEHDLTGYIRGADRFARGLNRSPDALQALVTNLATTADAFASEESNLNRAIAQLPRFLIAGQSALGELNEAFPPLRRLVADLRPAVRSSGPALDATLPLVQQLRGLVSEDELKGLARELRGVVPELTELNTGGVGVQQQIRLLSSCNNEVIVPWRNDKVPDAAFPASGPVYEEQVKWLPGIASESRGFDANGQFVKSLASGANNAYAIGGGRFLLSGSPLQGVNPPRKDGGAPPLRADVPCETQQTPDLRTIPQAPPTRIQANTGSAAYKARWAKAADRAIGWLRREYRRLDYKGKVLEGEVRPADVPRITSLAKRLQGGGR